MWIVVWVTPGRVRAQLSAVPLVDILALTAIHLRTLAVILWTRVSVYQFILCVVRAHPTLKCSTDASKVTVLVITRLGVNQST